MKFGKIKNKETNDDKVVNCNARSKQICLLLHIVKAESNPESFKVHIHKEDNQIEINSENFLDMFEL